jgi:sRNA-binding carbon storage regulator CsrA
MDIYTLDYNESIYFELNGKQIKVMLVENKVNPDEFALGVDAPRSVSVNREEIYNRKKARNRSDD